jgi:hypothetical protein
MSCPNCQITDDFVYGRTDEGLLWPSHCFIDHETIFQLHRPSHIAGLRRVARLCEGQRRETEVRGMSMFPAREGLWRTRGILGLMLNVI